jgi:hypothetical protein
VIAESIYEAAALGVSALKNSGWADAIAPGTELLGSGARAGHLSAAHHAADSSWCDGFAVSLDETLKKRRLKQLLA